MNVGKATEKAEKFDFLDVKTRELFVHALPREGWAYFMLLFATPHEQRTWINL